MLPQGGGHEQTEERPEVPAGAAAPAGAGDGGREPGRFSARRRWQWREALLGGGQTALKSRPADERDDEIQRLRAKVGEITMNNELLLERCHRLEANLPLPRRRPSE